MTDVLILGCDGYLGWPIFHDLRQHGYTVHGVDHFGAREYRGKSAVPIDSPEERFGTFSFAPVDITNYTALEATLRQTNPDTILNLAQIPSAPYSMASRENAWTTQRNNVLGALNLYWAIHELGLDTHVIQLATMGEYPTGSDIPEGFLDDGRPAPKEAGSIYHASKVNATVNTLFLARTWDIPTTECYQGIVYGVPEGIRTRFDVDAVWGTVLNRFTAQAAVGHPLTVYGRGGQKRAMLPIDDVLQCVRLLVENPPDGDAYRAVNQFHRAYRVRELAELVADRRGADIEHVENPRVEDDSDHDYDPHREVLDGLGYDPADDLEGVFERTYAVVCEHADRVDESVIEPDVTWE